MVSPVTKEITRLGQLTVVITDEFQDCSVWLEAPRNRLDDCNRRGGL
jgi:hypothetical protein